MALCDGLLFLFLKSFRVVLSWRTELLWVQMQIINMRERRNEQLSSIPPTGLWQSGEKARSLIVVWLDLYREKSLVHQLFIEICVLKRQPFYLLTKLWVFIWPGLSLKIILLILPGITQTATSSRSSPGLDCLTQHKSYIWKLVLSAGCSLCLQRANQSFSIWQQPS